VNEDTAPHTIVDLDIDAMLARSRVATAIGAALFVAAVILGAVVIGRAWPPPAIVDQDAHTRHT
jgi:hypothetical protein